MTRLQGQTNRPDRPRSTRTATLALAPTLALVVSLAVPTGSPAQPQPDFHLPDVNPASPRAGDQVSPRDYLGRVSVWYFGHET